MGFEVRAIGIDCPCCFGLAFATVGATNAWAGTTAGAVLSDYADELGDRLRAAQSAAALVADPSAQGARAAAHDAAQTTAGQQYVQGAAEQYVQAAAGAAVGILAAPALGSATAAAGLGAVAAAVAPWRRPSPIVRSSGSHSTRRPRPLR